MVKLPTMLSNLQGRKSAIIWIVHFRLCLNVHCLAFFLWPRDKFGLRCKPANYHLFCIVMIRGIRSRLALKVEGLARVSKNAGGRPRLASVAFDGRYMGLAL